MVDQEFGCGGTSTRGDFSGVPTLVLTLVYGPEGEVGTLGCIAGDFGGPGGEVEHDGFGVTHGIPGWSTRNVAVAVRVSGETPLACLIWFTRRCKAWEVRVGHSVESLVSFLVVVGSLSTMSSG